MKLVPASTLDRLELALLRLLSLGLGVLDTTLGVSWGERLLERLASRWQARLVQLDRALAELHVQREQVGSQAEALAIQVAAIYLGQRHVARGELCFDPADPHDDEILDATIEVLVKEQLAAIETQPVGQQQYLYRLEPDWQAIRLRLTRAMEGAQPEIAACFEEGVAFIDESFLCKAAA
jgi:hypothetical protein